MSITMLDALAAWHRGAAYGLALGAGGSTVERVVADHVDGGWTVLITRAGPDEVTVIQSIFGDLTAIGENAAGRPWGVDIY